MNNDLISREALKKNMEFICMGIMAGTEPYNAPLTEIDNAPTVEGFTKEDMSGAYNEGYVCGSREAEKARLQGYIDGATNNPKECKACDYYKLAQSFINGIVEVISKNGLTSIDELLEILKREANKNE